MDEELTLRESFEAKNEVNIKSFYIAKMNILCIFHEFEQAEKIPKIMNQYGNGFSPGFSTATFAVCEGLASLAMHGQERKRRKVRLAVGKRCLKQLQALSKYSPANYMSKVCLLEAEMAIATDDSLANAIEKFDQSIRFGNESELYSDVGMAAERAAHALRQNGRYEDANKYLTTALQAYRDWGAFAKVAQVNDQFKDVSSTGDETGMAAHIDS